MIVVSIICAGIIIAVALLAKAIINAAKEGFVEAMKTIRHEETRWESRISTREERKENT